MVGTPSEMSVPYLFETISECPYYCDEVILAHSDIVSFIAVSTHIRVDEIVYQHLSTDVLSLIGFIGIPMWIYTEKERSLKVQEFYIICSVSKTKTPRLESLDRIDLIPTASYRASSITPKPISHLL